MKTRKSNEFFSSLPQYIFVKEDADINEVTNLPDNENDYCVIDMDWCATNGCPPIDDEGADMVLWAILEPGEEI
jgi:hypothetical protein